MNRKLLLLLASSVLSTAVLINGSVVNAKLNVHPSNGAIIEQSIPDYTEELKAITSSKKSPILKLLDSTILYGDNGNYTEADEYFESLLGELIILKDSDEIQFNKYLKLCVDELIKLSESNSTSPCPKYYLFKMMELSDNYDLALASIKKCITLDKNNPVYKYELANLYCEMNQYEKAIRIYEDLKHQYPREKEFRVSLANAYKQFGAYDNAVREYRVATSFEPEDSDTVAALVNAATYARLAKSNSFYDPMKSEVAATRQTANTTPVTATTSVSSNTKPEVVAFGTNTTSFSSSQPYTTAIKDASGKHLSVKPASSTVKPTISNASNNYDIGMQTISQSDNIKNVRNTVKSNIKPETTITDTVQTDSGKYNVQPKNVKNAAMKTRQPRQTSSSSNKRIMVSYVNGRKVVKIVNVSQDTDVSQTLTNSANSVSQQLVSANSSSYDNSGIEQSSSKGQYSFASDNSGYNKENSDVFSSDSSYTTSKYNYSDKDYYSNRSTSTPTSSMTISSPQESQPNVYVSDKTGKKASTTSKTNKDKKQKTKSTGASNQATNDNTEIYLKANELLAQNQYQQVIDLLLKINPPTLRSLTSIASCYNALGNSTAALEYYHKADKLSPDNSQILFSLAYIYFSKNDTETAKKYLTRSLQIDPNNANAIQLKNYMSQQDSNEDMNKAVSYMNSGNYADSKKILDKLAQTDSSNFQVYYYLGHICYATQKYADAVQDFLKAIKLNSEYSLSYYSLGLAYDKLKKFNDSLASYEKFIQMSTDDNKYTQYAKTRINTIKAKK